MELMTCQAAVASSGAESAGLLGLWPEAVDVTVLVGWAFGAVRDGDEDNADVYIGDLGRETWDVGPGDPEKQSRRTE